MVESTEAMAKIVKPEAAGGGLVKFLRTCYHVCTRLASQILPPPFLPPLPFPQGLAGTLNTVKEVIAIGRIHTFCSRKAGQSNHRETISIVR
jgi:hypothetical protein